jgi:hypothetical protein
MSILEKLEKGPTREPKICKCASTLNLIDQTLANKIREVLAKIADNTGEYNSNWLSLTLREEGVFLNHQTLLRHARKTCCCYAD